MSLENERKKLEEARLVSRLWMMVLQSLQKRLKHQQPVNVQDVDDYKGETMILRNFAIQKTGLQWSLFSGVVGAIAFRQMRLALQLWVWRRSIFKNKKSYHLDPIEGGGKQQPPNPFRNGADTKTTTAAGMSQQPPRPHFVLRAIGMLGDIYFGGLVTSSVMNFYYLPRARQNVLTLLETVPLVEGRSVLSDAMCENIVEELRTHSALLQRGVEHPSLQSFLLFADNCQRRRAYETYLRRDQGLAADAAVPVPPPGVPSDYPVDDDSDSGMMGGSMDHPLGSEEDFYVDDQDWAASYTADQEEDARRKK